MRDNAFLVVVAVIILAEILLVIRQVVLDSRPKRR
jgi:hypothetical protein